MTRQRIDRGFTLVEVLVALAVVALVLVALLGSMQAVVASATAIQDRTIASWIAVDKVTEYRLSASFPEASRDSGEVEMAGIVWIYNVNIENVSASGDILTVITKVATLEEPEITLGIASGTLIRPASSTAQPGLPGGNPAQPGRPGGNAVRANGIAPSGGFGPPASGGVCVGPECDDRTIEETEGTLQ